MNLKSRSGVTLLELMVAMAVTVILLGVMYEVHREVMRVSQQAGGRVQRKREIRSVLEMISMDVQAMARGSDAALWVNPPTGDTSVTLLGLVKGEYGVAAIRYSWNGKKSGELRRAELPPYATFQAWRSGGAFQFPERFFPENEEVVLERVEAFQVRFFQSRDWHQSGALLGELPEELEIILNDDLPGKASEPYSIRVAIE